MGRLYAVTFENQSISAAQDLFEIGPAAQKPVALHGLILSNVGGTADAGDAQEELLRLTVVRGHTTSGSGGGTAGITALSPADTTKGFSVEVNNTTIASAGTAVTLLADGWNIRIPYQMFWTPETRPVCANAEFICVRLPAAPADAVSCSGTLYVEELA